jgi:single-strand DNA-binding protein
MKNLTIAGRLTKDATTRDAGGSRVTGFSVAVDNWDGKTKGTLFFDASMWGDRGEKVAPHLTKGTPVTVSGDLGTREHNGKTYLTIRVADVTLQGGKPASTYDLDDSIPF